MKRKAASSVRFAAGLLGLLFAGWALTGKAAGPFAEGVPTDWTHRHVIFSQPATSLQANRVAEDPRYWQQWYRQNVWREVAAVPDSPLLPSSYLAHGLNGKVQRDWSENLGSGASAGAGNFPAKYSFGITTANCSSATTPDYVVFNTGLLGSGSQASIVAYDNLYTPCLLYTSDAADE